MASRLIKVGTRLLVSGTLTKDCVDGFRELLQMLVENGAIVETVDLSNLRDLDHDGAELLAEFGSSQPQVHFDDPSTRKGEFLSQVLALKAS
ncbi:MAG: hypothetical protein QM756_08445 [Polyangiaceae bacterium]